MLGQINCPCAMVFASGKNACTAKAPPCEAPFSAGIHTVAMFQNKHGDSDMITVLVLSSGKCIR